MRPRLFGGHVDGLRLRQWPAADACADGVGDSNSTYTRYAGTVVRSVWKSGKWVKSATLQATKWTFSTVMKYHGFKGVTFTQGYEGD